MSEQLNALLEQLKQFGYDEQTLMLASAMKNMKDTGYGVILDIPIQLGQTVSGDVRIDRSDFAWKWLFYRYTVENAALNYDISIDVQFGSDRKAFKSVIPMADMFGNPRTQLWKINNPPIVIQHDSTVNITVTNVGDVIVAENPLQIFLMGNEKAGMM